MTIALCLDCGATKLGAFIPCSECGDRPVDMTQMAGQASSGNAQDILGRQDVNLSIAFSAHNFPQDTLKQFGQIIRSISAVCSDREVARHAFLKYVAALHPDVLTIEFPPYLSARAFQVLKQLDLAQIATSAPQEPETGTDEDGDAALQDLFSSHPGDPERAIGYAILQSTRELMNDYRPQLKELWQKLPQDPLQYQGTANVLDPLEQAIVPALDWFKPSHYDDPLIQARLELGTDTGQFLDGYVHDLAVTRRAAVMGSAAADLTVVQVRRAQFVDSAPVLGFDVGCWGGDHFSLICDSMVRPTWHPPSVDDFDALAEAVCALNEHFLFPSADTAARFRQRYMEFGWAENETVPGEFEVIQVELCAESE